MSFTLASVPPCWKARLHIQRLVIENNQNQILKIAIVNSDFLLKVSIAICILKNISWAPQDFYTTTGKAKLLNMQSGYLKDGGFPQYLSTGNPRYLKELYNDIIYRDIVVRHKLPSDRQIREVAYYLASNFTHRITYNGLAKAAGIKSSETANVYVGYLEEAYLVGVVRKYDYKVGEQQKSPKKVYFIDVLASKKTRCFLLLNELQ
ncbi:MAG: hypothetical protein MJZ87_11290, partial [Bacteroidales bacterium]|nr:hypothetical protein [Bacteroidales bacterium]